MLWIDKYKPKTKSDLIGCTRQFNKIYDWLVSGQRSSFRVAVISGPSGVGKSSLVDVVIKEIGYINVLRGDCLSRKCDKVIKDIIQAVDTRSLDAVFGGSMQRAKPSLIVLEDIDTITSLDKAGMVKLLRIIKQTCVSIPLICTCHSNSVSMQEIQSILLSKRAKNNIHIRMHNPNSADIAARLETILAKENVTAIPRNDLLKYCIGCGCDVRQCISGLEFHHKALISMDKDYTVMECISELFPVKKSFEAMEIVLEKYKDSMPGIIHENFYKAIPDDTPIERIAECAEEISMGDLVDNVFQRCYMPCKKLDSCLKCLPVIKQV